MSTEHPNAPAPDPAVAAVSVFTVVVLLLGLQFAQLAPSSSATAFLPVVIVAGIAQLILGIIAVLHGQHVIGLFFCTFGPFLLSFALLAIGLIHGWWPAVPAQIPHVESCFLIGWTAMLSLWLLLSIVLPLFFTLLLVLVNGALWTLIGGLWNASLPLEKAAGWLLILCAVGGGYFVAAHWLKWAGHDRLPLGGPLVRGRETGKALSTASAAAAQ